MIKNRLNKQEKALEKTLIKGEYKPVGAAEFKEIAQAIASRKKDAVLNIRVNSDDLDNLKKKAKKLGVPYQTFISELMHRFAA